MVLAPGAFMASNGLYSRTEMQRRAQSRRHGQDWLWGAAGLFAGYYIGSRWGYNPHGYWGHYYYHDHHHHYYYDDQYYAEDPLEQEVAGFEESVAESPEWETVTGLEEGADQVGSAGARVGGCGRAHEECVGQSVWC